MTQKTEEQPLEITRAVWDGVPRELKRRWKDGTRLMKMRRGGAMEWVKVFWKR